MKIRKKLLLLLTMIALTVITLGASTFAWLTLTQQVSVSNIQLNVSSGAGIGVGYSSMLYLKDLPVDAIKIDKEFTKYMVSDKITRVIVTRIVQMGSSLDLELIAEGVETERQSELLSRMGCEVIQGYLISQPVSEAEAIKLIEKYNGLNVKVETKVKDYKNDYKEILEETEEEDESSIDESIDDDSSNEDDIGGIE